MKWLFIILLLMNVLYFGWELDRQTRMEVTNSSSLPKLPDQAKRLQFLTELDTPPPLRNTELDSPLQTIVEADDFLSTTALDEYDAEAGEDRTDTPQEQLPGLDSTLKTDAREPGAI